MCMCLRKYKYKGVHCTIAYDGNHCKKKKKITKIQSIYV